MFLYLAVAIRNRGYTNEVRLRGLGTNQGFQPAQAGFACVAATSSRLVQDINLPLSTHSPELKLFGLLPYVTVAKAFVDLPEAEFSR